jgi:hypothetical protein
MRLLIGAGTPREAAARTQAWLVVLLTPSAVTIVVIIADEANTPVSFAIITVEPQ